MNYPVWKGFRLGRGDHCRVGITHGKGETTTGGGNGKQKELLYTVSVINDNTIGLHQAFCIDYFMHQRCFIRFKFWS